MAKKRPINNSLPVFTQRLLWGQEGFDLLPFFISQIAVSVNKIQAEVKALRQAQSASDIAEPAEIPLPQRLTIVTQQLKKAKVWDDPKKKRRLEKLLVELNSLIAE